MKSISEALVDLEEAGVVGSGHDIPLVSIF